MGKIKHYYYDNVKSSYKLYSDIVELFCSRFVATLGSESGDATCHAVYPHRVGKAKLPAEKDVSRLAVKPPRKATWEVLASVPFRRQNMSNWTDLASYESDFALRY